MEKKMHDKIIQITTKGEQLIGITASGYLARFDENLGAWIIRGRSEVLDSNNQIVLNHVVTDESPTKRPTQQIEIEPSEHHIFNGAVLKAVGLALIAAVAIAGLIRIYFR